MSTKVSMRKIKNDVKSVMSISKIILWGLILIMGINLIVTSPEIFITISLLALLIYKLPDMFRNIAAKNKTFTKQQFKLILSAFTPRQFEIFCYELFKALGYRAKLMPDGPDGGKDVILDNRIYVECKRYNDSKVGREICQKLLGAITRDRMNEGIIFTNGDIHQNAIEFLRVVDNVSIWDLDTIYENASELPNYKLSNIIDLVAEVDE
jgi:hypothetical protein